MIINTSKLLNNLPVINVDTQSFPSATIMLLLGAGSRYENERNNGVAHFFEHMAFKGSSKYKTAFEISSKIDGIGGIFNAFTSKDHTGYYIKAPVHHTSLVIDILSDMLLKPNLDPAEIEREKKVIIEEINMYEDMPARKVSDLYDELLYQGHSLAFDIAGTKESVSSLSRSSIDSYLKMFYQPQNAVLVMAGGFSQRDTPSKRSILQKGVSLKKEYPEFSEWRGSGEKVEIDKYEVTQKHKAVKVFYKKTEQAHFCLGYRAFSQFDKRRYALSVLSAILGGGMSSRLFIEVRERRGLCYYVSTSKDLYQDTGSLVTQAGVTNNVQKLNEAIKVIIHEHEKIASGDLKEEELIRAKEMIKGRFLLSLEDSQSVASFTGTKYLFEGATVQPSEIISEIENVTFKDVENLAKELFVSRGLNIAAIGPYKQDDIKI